jgi:SAM-dependent methyltransferase
MRAEQTAAPAERNELLRRLRNKVRTPVPIFRALHRNDEKFLCPICSYAGPFASFDGFGGVRKNAICPKCGSFERHRLQYLVLRDAVKALENREWRVLHFAPEASFRSLFARRFSRYETADLFMDRVDYKVDIREMPFEDASYDLVFASHVLEHLRDDVKAVREVRRILRPNGIAILPVPIVCEKTIEYAEANPFEAGHMRAPGVDYFDRFKEWFQKIDIYGSDCFPQSYQVYVFEDRTRWPSAECPLRPPMMGEKHIDLVPVFRA